MCTFLRQASVVRAAPEAVGKILNKIVKQNVSVQGLVSKISATLKRRVKLNLILLVLESFGIYGLSQHFQKCGIRSSRGTTSAAVAGAKEGP